MAKIQKKKNIQICSLTLCLKIFLRTASGFSRSFLLAGKTIINKKPDNFQYLPSAASSFIASVEPKYESAIISDPGPMGFDIRVTVVEAFSASLSDKRKKTKQKKKS